MKVSCTTTTTVSMDQHSYLFAVSKGICVFKGIQRSSLWSCCHCSSLRMLSSVKRSDYCNFQSGKFACKKWKGLPFTIQHNTKKKKNQIKVRIKVGEQFNCCINHLQLLKNQVKVSISVSLDWRAISSSHLRLDKLLWCSDLWKDLVSLFARRRRCRWCWKIRGCCCSQTSSSLPSVIYNHWGAADWVKSEWLLMMTLNFSNDQTCFDTLYTKIYPSRLLFSSNLIRIVIFPIRSGLMYWQNYVHIVDLLGCCVLCPSGLCIWVELWTR